MIDSSNKVSVFISSKCDNAEDIENGRIKYGVVRKALKLLLEESGMCNVYVFEESNATSNNVINSYMDKLDDADLVVVLVDNKDGITNATLKEIGRIKALEKKCFYFFCDEREKKITELQAELQSSTKNPRYKIVHEFSDIAKEAYDAVINDVLNIYIGYCKGRLNFEEENQEISEQTVSLEIQMVQDSDITKKFISGFSFTKYIVRKEANVAFGKIECDDPTDERCASVLGWIIGSSMLAEPDFYKVKQDIKFLHKGNMQKIVLLRYDALEEYFFGNIAGCVSKIKECINFCDSCKNIPKWLYNDIALDMRNLQLEIDREQDVIDFRPEGQRILDQDQEPLYYPVIDRIVSDYHESIVKHQLNNVTQSPYSINIGGVDANIDKACDAFLVAYFYGSITHMLMTRKRLYEYMIGLALEIRNHRTFMFCVELLLLSNEDKMLKQFLNSYGENTNNINAQDVEHLLKCIEKQPVKTRRIMAKQQALKYFGYYYSDKTFYDEFNDLMDLIKQCISDKYATGILIKPMLEVFSENSYRIEENTILDFIYLIFEVGYKRYYNDAFKFLYNFRFHQLTKMEQLKYQEFIIASACNEEIKKECGNLGLAAQTLRQYETIPHERLDMCIKEKYDSFYENTYLLNITNHDSETGWKYTKRYVEIINKDNENQGKNGLISGRAYDPYLTIANIMFNDKLKYTSFQLKYILESLIGTLYSDTQTVEAKAGAIELICMLQLTHSQNRQIKKIVEEIDSKWESVHKTKDLLLVRGYSENNLNLNFTLLKSMFNRDEEMELSLRLMHIQNSEVPEQITALRYIERLMTHGFMERCIERCQNTLFQFVLNETYSENCDVRFYAMSALVKMMNEKHRQICLERFVEMMDNEPFKGKVGLLYRLKKEDLSDPKIKFIFDKGINDSHFWVRKVASEVLDEKKIAV